MVKVTIDSIPVEVDANSTILQACEKAGVEIPVFCYHPKLSIAGNCRMCLVEVEKAPKLAASCAMPVMEGMVIHTHSEKVKEARQGTLEFLLINHPLDCPICDQGGECDLQDITMSYGRGRSRFEMNKRAVPNKEMGPLIGTHMTRCIHCTRCVRFAHEIAGTSEVGTMYRGEDMEITTLLNDTITSELSGNLIDICPVGALTNKPYAFQGRSWELLKTPSIDVMDGVGSHIRLDTKSRLEVMRILPRACHALNEEWISDKARFCYDGLKYQRLDRPYMRHCAQSSTNPPVPHATSPVSPSHKETSSRARLHTFSKHDPLLPVSWDEAMGATSKILQDARHIAIVAGDLTDMETLYSATCLAKNLEAAGKRVTLESRTRGSRLTPTSHADFLFNTSIQNVEHADICVVIGANPRFEASAVNTRLKKRMWQGDFHVGVIGPDMDLSYDYTPLGHCAKDIACLLDVNHPFTQKLARAKYPMIIVGESVLAHEDWNSIQPILQHICASFNVMRNDWHGYSVLHVDAASVGSLALGYHQSSPHSTLSGNGDISPIEALYQGCENQDIDTVYLLNADNVDMSRLKHARTIYQGHHGDRGASGADIVLAGMSFAEKRGTYMNIEGVLQQTMPAIKAPGHAREDWRIIHMCASACNLPLSFQTQEELLSSMGTAYPNLGHQPLQPSMQINQAVLTKNALAKHVHALTSVSLEPVYSNHNTFYTSNVITRHSRILAQVRQDIQKRGPQESLARVRMGDQSKETKGAER